MKKTLQHLFILFAVILFLPVLGLISPVSAADFAIDVEREYVFQDRDKIRVIETHTVRNNSVNRLLSANNTEVFQINAIIGKEDTLEQSVLGAKAFVDGVITQFTVNKLEDRYEVVIPYTRSVGVGGALEFRLEYDNFGLIEQNGALLDMYAPGFTEDFSFSGDDITLGVNTILKINRSLPELNFIVPAAEFTGIEGDFLVYQLPQENLIGNNIWVQFGKTQYYSFEFTQLAPATDDIDRGYFNQYQLVLPRNILQAEVEQEVFFTEITPDPYQVLEDEEGNLIGYFEFPAHKANTVKIKGYAVVKSLERKVTAENSGDLSDVDREKFARYLGQAEYWEVGDPAIQAKAIELKGDKTNIYEIVETTYSYIVETIDYSQVKRFGLNERQGALKTLNGGAAVCMEYSDLFLTLMRAQGVPARAAFGYGYDARLIDQQDAHQWVEVYIPGVDNWISVDVTWGESGPALIGGDLNHFFTHVAAVDPNKPSTVERISYGDQTNLEAPDFNVDVAAATSEVEVMNVAQLLNRYPRREITRVENVLSNFNLNPKLIRNVEALIYDDPARLMHIGYALIGLALVIMLLLALKIFRHRPKPAKSMDNPGNSEAEINRVEPGQTPINLSKPDVP